MNEPIFAFSATVGGFMGKIVADVQVFSDRIIVHRDTKRPNIPKDMILSFRDIASIAYDEVRTEAWIRFAVSNSAFNASIQQVVVMKPGTIQFKMAPFDDPYAIIFPRAQKKEAKEYYQQLLNLQQKAIGQAVPVPAENSESSLDKLKKLKELLDMGVLSASEYEQKRTELFRSI